MGKMSLFVSIHPALAVINDFAALAVAFGIKGLNRPLYAADECQRERDHATFRANHRPCELRTLETAS
jgi:hypothetical protein